MEGGSISLTMTFSHFPLRRCQLQEILSSLHKERIIIFIYLRLKVISLIINHMNKRDRHAKTKLCMPTIQKYFIFTCTIRANSSYVDQVVVYIFFFNTEKDLKFESSTIWVNKKKEFCFVGFTSHTHFS